MGGQVIVLPVTNTENLSTDDIVWFEALNHLELVPLCGSNVLDSNDTSEVLPGLIEPVIDDGEELAIGSTGDVGDSGAVHTYSGVLDDVSRVLNSDDLHVSLLQRDLEDFHKHGVVFFRKMICRCRCLCG
ncbi:hypothetical protein WICPIJ_006372 [Wickerhamomyces pijperi]|uniref:Uncharacterized protein n=1 Tax=Wickerhamomyces pijperi TaxID=599730 RepID=A0A9P8Q291_WICPI|nr:hypothetical protein WICPIJ_006372 [Wickerhamomyces pijperi]